MALDPPSSDTTIWHQIKWQRRIVIGLSLLTIALIVALIYETSLTTNGLSTDEGDRVQTHLPIITALVFVISTGFASVYMRTQRKYASSVHEWEMQLHEEGTRLSGLVAAQQEIANSGLDIETILSTAVKRSLDTTGADGAMIELPENSELVCRAAAGQLSYILGSRVPIEGSLSGTCITTGEMLMSDDVEHDERVNTYSLHGMPVGSMAVIPLKRGDDKIGVLKVTSRTLGAFNSSQIQAFQVLAGTLSPVLSDAKTFVESQKILRDRTNAYQALQESETRAETVLESLDEGVLLVDHEGVVMQTNSSATRILSVKSTELIGSVPFDRTWNPITEDGTELSEAQHNELRATSERTTQRDLVLGLEKGDHVTWLSLNTYPLSKHNNDPDTPEVLVISFRDITDRKVAESRLKQMALNDALTGLPNRRVLVDRLEHALDRARRNGLTVGVLFVDLDRFKSINDSLGHESGDELLREVAKRLLNVLRPSDTAARLGGDEFVVVCEDLADSDAARNVAERIKDSLSEPYDIQSESVVITASVGVVLSSLGSTSEELLRNADRAMYKAKEEGRSQYQMFNDSIAERAVERLEIERGLRQAIDHDQLILHYQPIVDLTTGKISGVEALIRWRHPERGLVLPTEFIDIAEDSGAIVPMGSWALHTACRQVAQGIGNTTRPISLAVNVSGRQAARPEFRGTVQHALEESGLDPSLLHLELTESVFLEAGGATISGLSRLKELGIHLSIDDFGTGYSSLTYLRRFPVDSVKVDRSFVSGVRTERHDEAIVEAVISLGGTFNLEVIAEGVENFGQAERLRELGCAYAQGFFFGAPKPAEELGDFN